MRNFLKLADNVLVLPIVHMLIRNPTLWNQDQCRTSFENTPHKEVDDILLRFGSTDGDDLEAVDREMMKTLPVKGLCLNIMSLVQGSRLGRVVITKLEPGGRILPHSDVMGEYSKYYSRYHVVLQGLPGSIFTCGDETVNMQTGEVWWFDAHQQHEVRNNSKDDRIHLMVDVRIDP